MDEMRDDTPTTPAQDGPITLSGADYWRIKALELEGQILRREMQASYERWQQRQQAAYAEAGLDAATVYAMDDQALTMTAQRKGDA